MRHKIFLLLALLAATITFTACSSDDDNEKQGNTKIVGTWTTNTDGYTDEIRFLSNGTCYENIPADEYRYTGSYKLNGNKLTIRWTKGESWNSCTKSWETDDEEPETVVITIGINGNKLTFYSMEGEEDNDPVVYTRK